MIKAIEDKYYYMNDYQPTRRGIERWLGDGDKRGSSQMRDKHLDMVCLKPFNADYSPEAIKIDGLRRVMMRTIEQRPWR